jgi:hypothetical protein
MLVLGIAGLVAGVVLGTQFVTIQTETAVRHIASSSPRGLPPPGCTSSSRG